MAGREQPSVGRPEVDDEGASRISLWEKLAGTSAAAPRTVLTPGRIAEVAVGIADAEGIDAVTMRRLAGALGVAPMAAYRYVSGKDDLLELMVDQVYSELVAPEPDADWRTALRTIAVRMRALMLRHPWLTRLPSSRATLALTPHRMAVAEWGMLALDGLGLDVDAMMAAVDSLGVYVQGRTAAEVAREQLMVGQGAADGGELRTSLAPEMTWLLGTGRYPTFHRYTREATRKDDPQWQFETGLDCLLDGIAVRMGI
ncbi:TetR/AcrR family transcriptional regulator [Embleya sp. NBC_00896]|uniref:TetR/AcrR family transcriptional regulator n=1 Tax=Embleya sp. NBC_00896 TaxID=2975961 RepID=UPI003865B358|nr:TetR/AcrR family transcriptional regulator [Embleya sp. NBC_00896]